MSIRLLVTARDAAAALHLIEVVREAQRGDAFEVGLVTQSPATRYFQQASIATSSLEVAPVRARDAPDGARLLAIARDILERERPDAILCGLSTPFDGGIDEAMIAAYEGPSFVMQDFWGEANDFFGKKADLYLALDEEAVRLSRLRHDVDAVIVGSPRHSAYARLDVRRVRAQIREQLPAGSGTVYGFFGQGLHALAGYRNTLRIWAAAVLEQPGATAVYRPHPRESEGDAAWTINLFKDAGLEPIVLDRIEVEHALLACDVVCSAFSNCTYDAAYLNYFSDEPLITPMSLFFEPDLIAYFHAMVRLKEFPYIKGGLVMPVSDGRSLPGLLAGAGTPAEKRRYWLAAQKLINPSQAPALALDAILARCRKAGAIR